MDRHLEAADLFARIAQDLISEGDEERTLERTVHSALRVVSGCDVAGISVAQGRHVEAPASTDPVVDRLDDLQYQLDEGPCLDALRAPEDVFVSAELAHDQRWPRWAPRAAELGMRSILSVRLPTTRAVLAGLNLYGRGPDAFDQDDVHVALVFARHAAIALQVTHQVANLETAIESRHRIGVAQGMLMQRFGLTVDQSFSLLLRVSQTKNVKLRDVARKVIEGDLDDLVPSSVTASASLGGRAGPGGRDPRP